MAVSVLDVFLVSQLITIMKPVLLLRLGMAVSRIVSGRFKPPGDVVACISFFPMQNLSGGATFDKASMICISHPNIKAEILIGFFLC